MKKIKLIFSMGFVVAFIALLLATLIVSKAHTQSSVKAVPSHPKKDNVKPKPTLVPRYGNLEQTDRYHHILVQYLHNASSVTLQQNQAAIASYRSRLASRQKLFEDINAHEMLKQQVLEDAVRGRQGKQLDFDGEVPETTLAVLNSSASGRIFTLLCQEKKVNELMLIATARFSSILPASPRLTPEWVALVKDIDRRHQGDIILHKIVVKLLYAAGIDTTALRPAMVQLAVKSSDYDALNLLFFTNDLDTGEANPIISQENLTILKNLIGSPNLYPEEQLVCAKYALAVYDYDDAEAICASLLKRKYKGDSNLANRNRLDDDYALGRAREGAMNLMFYGIHNEPMLQIIYNLSVADQKQVQNNFSSKVSLPVNQDALESERLDIGFAESYIQQASAWKDK